MSVSFASKLDFLMKLTNTANTTLGRAISFDPSHISRIRSGQRGVPRKQPFIQPAAAYFARNLRDAYQKQALLAEMGLERDWPEREEEAAELLCAWMGEETSGGDGVRRLIDSFTESTLPPSGSPGREGVPETGVRAEAVLFYGNRGKRDAVIQFLSELGSAKSPRTLLLYSSEEMSWLYEDPTFERAWAELLMARLKEGWRVRIIHTISRDLTEMWEAVRKWLPLYMTGGIEPYYYPRLTDGATRRTLFVAEGRSAIVSSSVSGQKGEPLNILLHDPAAVQALRQEFTAFLALCGPLMEIATPADLSELRPLYQAFLDAPGQPLAAVDTQYAICAKDGFGALVMKASPPYAVFSIREERMVTAVEEYLRSLPGDHTAQALDGIGGML